MGPSRRRQTSARKSSRRTYIILVFVFVAGVIIWSSTSTTVAVPSVPSVADLSETAKHAADIIYRPKLPKLYNPFSDLVHEPPEQADSSHGFTRWYSDLKWLNPFSSDTTLDEQRAVLPPLAPRTPIYTFYDANANKDPKVVEAEHKLLLTWRRAWWAKGFRPIVLGRPEAMKNPLYQKWQKVNSKSTLENDVMRWLAWGHMGGGIMANWLALPMTRYEDSTLQSLRQSKFTGLTLFKGVSSGLVCGAAANINSALKEALESASLAQSTTLTDLFPSSSITYASHGNSIAYYDMKTITANYKTVGVELSNNQVVGLGLLHQLMNAHLHITWQNIFTDGVAVLQPHPLHTTTMVDFAFLAARNLLQCPESPLPASCPPNQPACLPCKSSSAANMDVSTPQSFRNKTTQFTIGTVPHPYTFAMLHYSKESLDVSFVRRKTERDMWLTGATVELLGDKIGGPQRLSSFKDAVASNYASAHSLWLTPELDEPLKLEWLVGFGLPRSVAKDASGVAPKKGAFVPTSSELAREKMLLELARETLRSKRENPTVKMVEAWNMADTEAWRFVEAFAVRRRLEREKWEDQEKKFAGAEDDSEGL